MVAEKENNTEQELTLMIEKINDLYVMTRFKYLAMYIDTHSGASKWSTVQKGFLTDYNVKKHLTHSSTLGVFSGQELTKFICFDIDSPSLSHSQNLFHLLMFTLVDVFNVPKLNLISSFSGKKGYHLEIFFSEAISLNLAFSFYKVVLDYIQHNLIDNSNLLYGDIEFRPTFNQGVKLPLSIHKSTNNFCSFVNNESLKVIDDPNYLLSIQKLDVDVFKSKVLDSMICDITNDNFFTLENKKAVDTENLLNEVKPYQKLTENYIEDMEKVLIENRLLRNGSRNNTTFNLGVYLKNIGENKEEAKKIIKRVLINTWENHRHMLSKETKYNYMLEEVERITEYVYSKNGSNKKKETTYRIYKLELLKILEIPKKHLRKLMFSMYIHSKKYAKKDGTFYMAYSVIAKMGNCKNPSVILRYLIELQELGYIEIVQRNTKNKAMLYESSRENNQMEVTKIYETNIYKILIDEPACNTDDYLEVGLDEDINLLQTVVKMVSEKEARKKLSYKQFYNEYKPEYTKAPEKDI